MKNWIWNCLAQLPMLLLAQSSPYETRVVRAGDSPEGLRWPQSLIALDLNRDRWPDFVCVTRQGLAVMAGTETGIGRPAFLPLPEIGDFLYSVQALSVKSSPDLVVHGLSGIAILRSNGTGGFESRIAWKGEARSVIAADVNGDPYADLIVTAWAGFLEEDVLVLLGNPDGTFQEPSVADQLYIALGVQAADIDSDGFADLLTSTFYEGLQVRLGKGDGSFSAAKPVDDLGSVFVVADFNRDGRLDLVTMSSQDSVCVALNRGNQEFGPCQRIKAGYLATSVSTVDINRDGNVDLAIVNSGSYSVTIALGKGDGTFGPSVGFPAGKGPNSAAAGDVDGDDRLDLVFANSTGQNLSLLKGDGKGGFGDPRYSWTATEFVSLALGDFNGDGVADIAAISRSDDTVQVWYGAADGVFGGGPKVFPTDLNPGGLVTADFDSDGNSDLAIALGSDKVAIWLGKPGGTFRIGRDVELDRFPASNMSVADFNRDGKPDLCVTHPAGRMEVFLGNGDGTFRLSANESPPGPASTAVADFNGDGVPDIVLGNGTGFSFAAGKGDGTFAAPVNERLETCRQITIPNLGTGNQCAPVRAAAGDFDGDGKMDVIASTLTIWFVRGNGDGTFQSAVRVRDGNYQPVHAADLDSDGRLDVLLAASVLYGNGDGTFAPPQELSQGATAVGVADLNRDGRPDVVVVGVDTLKVLLRRASDDANPHLQRDR